MPHVVCCVRTAAYRLPRGKLELEPDCGSVKAYADLESEASARLNVRNVPTLVLFRNGPEAARASGAKHEDPS